MTTTATTMSTDSTRNDRTSRPISVRGAAATARRIATSPPAVRWSRGRTRLPPRLPVGVQPSDDLVDSLDKRPHFEAGAPVDESGQVLLEGVPVQGAEREPILDRLLADVLVAGIGVELAPAEILEPGRIDVVDDDLRTLDLGVEIDPRQLQLAL